MIMYYYSKIEKADGAYIVSFPDLPSVNTYGDTIDEALKNAAEALNGALETDFERGYTLPQAKERPGRNFHPIEVYPHIEIAYTLRQLRKEFSQKEIAAKLGVSPQAYQKLENPRKCNPTIKTLERIGTAFNRRVEVCFR
jgi:antitoxin HicB